ncbi:hypothetical protein FF38_10383 [Lucilia cuprina]|uniref:Uncharacterized protein n=1 Tax=Lucilia cuprina TaxID=7375 RepID=A0A0L0C0J3_LUCCU|nr:hypothetical protein FF38_10383 [Lucilia cuprina]
MIVSLLHHHHVLLAKYLAPESVIIEHEFLMGINNVTHRIKVIELEREIYGLENFELVNRDSETNLKIMEEILAVNLEDDESEATVDEGVEVLVFIVDVDVVVIVVVVVEDDVDEVIKVLFKSFKMDELDDIDDDDDCFCCCFKAKEDFFDMARLEDVDEEDKEDFDVDEDDDVVLKAGNFTAFITDALFFEFNDVDVIVDDEEVEMLLEFKE